MACNLNTSPRHNWVEDCGGLGDIANVACHMMERGTPKAEAIPAAINFAKHVCATDQSKNFAISNPTHHVAGWKQARWCAAVQHWEALKACAHAKSGTKAVETATFEGALDEKAQVVDEGNKLIIRGIAAEFGLDRDGEAFDPGAFDAGVKAFLENNPILSYHHATKPSLDGEPARYLQLGRVTKLERKAHGMEMEAEIPKPSPGSWAEDIYYKVRDKMIKGLSVGGAFKRRWTEKGPRIFGVDLQEIALTPLPVNPRTLLTAVVEGKAVDGEAIRWQPVEQAPTDEEFFESMRLEERVGALEAIAEGLEALASARRV